MTTHCSQSRFAGPRASNRPELLQALNAWVPSGNQLNGLADSWSGSDFEEFAAQIDQTRALIEGVLDDIDATAGELRNRGDASYTLQGGDSGEISSMFNGFYPSDSVPGPDLPEAE